MREGAPTLLGAVLAGGESSRFGRPKGLAPLRGRPMVQWALHALEPHFPKCVVMANDPAYGQALGVPTRRDRVPGMGPLAGLSGALHWAREEGFQGVFLLGCDLPLVTQGLVERILRHGFRGKEALVPASAGPLGMEPLCAAYTLECLSAADELLGQGRRSMKGLLEAVGHTLVPITELGSGQESARSFMNVNTPEDAEIVEALLKEDECP